MDHKNDKELKSDVLTECDSLHQPSKSDSQDSISGNDILKVSSEVPVANSGDESGVQSVELPSSVSDREEIYWPPHIHKNDPGIFGKWLFFTHGDLKEQDYIWVHLQPLVSKGIILLASSTAKKCNDRGPYQGVVKCYTCKDIEVIKNVGLAIQSVLKDNIILNYKTNEASEYNLYRARGNKFITEYMLTTSGKFYEKDKLSRWKQMTDDDIKNRSLEEHCSKVTQAYLGGSSRSYALGSFNSGYGVLPSKETRQKRYAYPVHALLNNFSGIWCLFCDITDTDADGETELDRIWKEARNLRDEGYFDAIFCETGAFTSFPGDNMLRRTVTCEISNYREVDLVIRSADKLRERIQYNMPIYLKICYYDEVGKLKYLLKYLYTDDRYLYEYVEKRWKLLKKA